MNKFKMVIVLSVITLTGCNAQGELEGWQVDQKLRSEIFEKCLTLLPAGPQSTQYNDWSEVVDSCENAAYNQSKKWMRKDPQKGWVELK